MSLKGTHPVKAGVVGSHAVLSPLACRICWANPTQAAPPLAISTLAIDGVNPDGRKKFVRAAATHGAPVMPLTPHGAAPDPTNSGPPAAAEFGSPNAACQFFTSRSPRGVLALIGRFR